MVFRDVFYSVTLYLVWLYLSMKITDNKPSLRFSCKKINFVLYYVTLHFLHRIQINRFSYFENIAFYGARKDKKHTGHLCTYVVEDFSILHMSHHA